MGKGREAGKEGHQNRKDVVRLMTRDGGGCVGNEAGMVGCVVLQGCKVSSRLATSALSTMLSVGRQKGKMGKQ